MHLRTFLVGHFGLKPPYWIVAFKYITPRQPSWILAAILNSMIEYNIRIKLLGLGNIIYAEKILNIGGIAAEICAMEHL